MMTAKMLRAYYKADSMHECSPKRSHERSLQEFRRSYLHIVEAIFKQNVSAGHHLLLQHRVINDRLIF